MREPTRPDPGNQGTPGEHDPTVVWRPTPGMGADPWMSVQDLAMTLVRATAEGAGAEPVLLVYPEGVAAPVIGTIRLVADEGSPGQLLVLGEAAWGRPLPPQISRTVTRALEEWRRELLGS